MFDNFFTWNHDSLIHKLLPPIQRKPKMKAWLNTLASGLKMVWVDIKAFRISSEYDNYFVQDLNQFQKYLQDEFGAGILIEHSIYKDPIILYKRTENKPFRLYNKSEGKPPSKLYFLTEFEVQIHFVIKIPSSLNLSEAEETRLRAYVDERKQPNKNYIIQAI